MNDDLIDLYLGLTLECHTDATISHQASKTSDFHHILTFYGQITFDLDIDLWPLNDIDLVMTPVGHIGIILPF